MNQKTYYEILGVGRYASQAEIKKAYRRLCSKLHPDRNPDPKAAERLKQVNPAYETLSDPRRRAEYDAFLRSEFEQNTQSRRESPDTGNSNSNPDNGPTGANQHEGKSSDTVEHNHQTDQAHEQGIRWVRLILISAIGYYFWDYAGAILGAMLVVFWNGLLRLALGLVPIVIILVFIFRMMDVIPVSDNKPVSTTPPVVVNQPSAETASNLPSQSANPTSHTDKSNTNRTERDNPPSNDANSKNNHQEVQTELAKYVQLLNTLINEHKWIEATALSEKLIHLDTANKTFWALRTARIRMEYEGASGALRYLDLHTELQEGNADFLAFYGELLRRISRHEEAIAFYRKAIDLNDTNGLWWRGVGLSYEAIGQIQLAREAFAKAEHYCGLKEKRYCRAAGS